MSCVNLEKLDKSKTLAGRLEEEHFRLIDSSSHLSVNQKNLEGKDIGKGHKYSSVKRQEKSMDKNLHASS